MDACICVYNVRKFLSGSWQWKLAMTQSDIVGRSLFCVHVLHLLSKLTMHHTWHNAVTCGTNRLQVMYGNRLQYIVCTIPRSQDSGVLGSASLASCADERGDAIYTLFEMFKAAEKWYTFYLGRNWILARVGCSEFIFEPNYSSRESPWLDHLISINTRAPNYSWWNYWSDLYVW